MEDFPTKEVVERVNRELDMSRVSGSSASSGDWQGLVHTMALQEKGTQASDSAFMVRQFATSLDANFQSPTHGLEVARVF